MFRSTPSVRCNVVTPPGYCASMTLVKRTQYPGRRRGSASGGEDRNTGERGGQLVVGQPGVDHPPGEVGVVRGEIEQAVPAERRDDHLLLAGLPARHGLADAAAGTLPSVAFVEPRFVDERTGTSGDDHPFTDIRTGDAFLAEVFHALASGPDWESTVLIVTYNEWGGFFDHVAPPRAVTPNAVDPDQFDPSVR